MEKTLQEMFDELTFKFAQYTEITDLAFKANPGYDDGNYKRFFLCLDTHDFWLVRIQEGWNQEYERQEGMWLLERDKIEKDSKGEDVTFEKLIDILENDSFENWDVYENEDLDELLTDYVDGGYGINNFKIEV